MTTLVKRKPLKIPKNSNPHFLASIPYFEEINVGLWDHLALCVFVYPP
jgi:hypothetical protein